LWSHELIGFELFLGHVGEIVDSLFPGVITTVVLDDCFKVFVEDAKSEISFGKMSTPIFSVDFFSLFISQLLSTVEEISVLHVQVLITESEL
jgi:hypothetical protein